MGVKTQLAGLSNEPAFWESVNQNNREKLAQYEESEKLGDKSMTDAIKQIKKRIVFIDEIVEQLKSGSLEPVEYKTRSRAA